MADAAVLGEVFAESWRLAYRGVIPHLHLESMIQRRGPEWWQNAMRSGENILVLEVCDKIAGYATWGASRTRGVHQGEIYELYLRPDYQGLGFGEHLFEAARHTLEMRGHAGLIVWALADNQGAIDFYWRRGGKPVAERVEEIGGAKLKKLAFEWN